MQDILILFLTFTASLLIGHFLISRVPTLLHTPLMSMTNAISAVTILGALILFSHQVDAIDAVWGSIALILSAFNVVGGFVTTDRMLKLFHKR